MDPKACEFTGTRRDAVDVAAKQASHSSPLLTRQWGTYPYPYFYSVTVIILWFHHYLHRICIISPLLRHRGCIPSRRQENLKHDIIGSHFATITIKYDDLDFINLIKYGRDLWLHNPLLYKLYWRHRSNFLWREIFRMILAKRYIHIRIVSIQGDFEWRTKSTGGEFLYVYH